MKSAEEWTNELDQDARQRAFWKQCLYAVKKIRAEARVAALKEAETYCKRIMKKYDDIPRKDGYGDLNWHDVYDGIARAFEDAVDNIRQLANSPAPEKCGTCGGEGVIDSGGQDIHSQWVNVPCPDCNKHTAEE